NAETDSGAQVDLTLFGVEPDSFLAPSLSAGSPLGDPAGIVVSETMREEGVEIGTVLTLERVGTELEVVGFTEGQATFGHVDVAWTPLATWQLITLGEAPAAAPTAEDLAAHEADHASDIALQGVPGSPLAAGDPAALDRKSTRLNSS